MTSELSADASRAKAAEVLEMTASIVSAYVTRNAVTVGELPALIASVYASLIKVPYGAPAIAPSSPPVPPVSIKKSITDDFLVCLEDGKKYKSLKRHLSTKYGLTPADYRAKWGLPFDYPMVAPTYAAQRSELAKQIGLGATRKKTPTKPAKKKVA